jgi:hypothetical protein
MILNTKIDQKKRISDQNISMESQEQMDSKFAAGRIDVILGPMFAGKTTELIRRVHRAESQRLFCIVLSYSPTMESQILTTHDHLSVPITGCPAPLHVLRRHCDRRRAIF